MAKCKCKIKPRFVSDVIHNMGGGCRQDVCTTPLCGEPDQLSIFAPLVYDEIGINLCATFPLGITLPADYPTAASARISVINATYTYGEGNVEIAPISQRPNCSAVTLSNISVQFAVTLYDANCRTLGTVYPTAVYLPPEATDPTYDEDTNPTSAELEIFTPYGISYAAGDTPTPALNFIGLSDGANTVKQGLNLYAIAKVLDLDTDDSQITVGLTLVVQSLYFAGYKVKNCGRIDVPKGSILTPEDSDCMRFVEGGLLNLEIKPLDLGAPNYGELDKTDYAQENQCGACKDHAGTVSADCGCNSYVGTPTADCGCNGYAGRPTADCGCNESCGESGSMLYGG